MKAYQDKETQKWKWGKNGKAIYETKDAAERGGMDILIKRLQEIRSKVDGKFIHGK